MGIVQPYASVSLVSIVDGVDELGNEVLFIVIMSAKNWQNNYKT